MKNYALVVFCGAVEISKKSSVSFAKMRYLVSLQAAVVLWNAQSIWFLKKTPSERRTSSQLRTISVYAAAMLVKIKTKVTNNGMRSEAASL